MHINPGLGNHLYQKLIDNIIQWINSFINRVHAKKSRMKESECIRCILVNALQPKSLIVAVASQINGRFHIFFFGGFLFHYYFSFFVFHFFKKILKKTLSIDTLKIQQKKKEFWETTLGIASRAITTTKTKQIKKVETRNNFLNSQKKKNIKSDHN